MADLSLAAKDKYLQRLGSKVCAAQRQEPHQRKLVSRKMGTEESHQLKKKKRKKQPLKEQRGFQAVRVDLSKPAQVGIKENQNFRVSKTELGSFSAVNLLRQRLHDKIEESRGQVNQRGLSSEELKKLRLRRKQERERKKRKRKELRIKKEQETLPQEECVASDTQKGETTKECRKVEEQIIFNKIEVSSQVVNNKILKKKEKKGKIKGGVTPLTGKNYKQLLSRLEARKSKIEELKSKDEDKAKEIETKMKWTNALYRAEGVKIKDNEEMLKIALKRKEKLKAQRQKNWEKRTEQVVEKMQHRQNKRQRNLKKKKLAKIERKKDKARKKGRVLPEDIKKAQL
uniref:Surfeit locus protein 6 n=1 Tax=Callorhinchus milii TaxID=7868 RepID=V9KZK4_CALMI